MNEPINLSKFSLISLKRSDPTSRWLFCRKVLLQFPLLIHKPDKDWQHNYSLMHWLHKSPYIRALHDKHCVLPQTMNAHVFLNETHSVWISHVFLCVNIFSAISVLLPCFGTEVHNCVYYICKSHSPTAMQCLKCRSNKWHEQKCLKLEGWQRSRWQVWKRLKRKVQIKSIMKFLSL